MPKCVGTGKRDMVVWATTEHVCRGGVIVHTIGIRLVANAFTADVQGWQRDGWEHQSTSGQFPNGKWTKVIVEHGTSAAK